MTTFASKLTQKLPELPIWRLKFLNFLTFLVIAWSVIFSIGTPPTVIQKDLLTDTPTLDNNFGLFAPLLQKLGKINPFFIDFNGLYNLQSMFHPMIVLVLGVAENHLHLKT